MSARLTLLHALRLALIHRIWFLAVHIPGFRPQAGISREQMLDLTVRTGIALQEAPPNPPAST